MNPLGTSGIGHLAHGDQTRGTHATLIETVSTTASTTVTGANTPATRAMGTMKAALGHQGTGLTPQQISQGVDLM